jgi:transcriptional regulator with XRE-family HTH domain
MAFAEKFKDLRTRAGISQQRLAVDLDLAIRTVGKYENGHVLPSAELLMKISKYFGVSIDSLLTEQEEHIANAYEKGGAKGAREVSELIEEFSGMFASGRLSEDDKDAAMRALLEAYWIAKDETKKKYTPKKHRTAQLNGE